MTATTQDQLDTIADGPRLSYREEQVARLLGKGWSYQRIAASLKKPDGSHLTVGCVARYASQVADKIPNPDNLSTQMLVALWQARRDWEAQSAPEPRSA